MDQGSSVLVGWTGSFLFGLSDDGKRVVYQASSAGSLQYFFCDEVTRETRQLTNDPYAIVESGSATVCPRVEGSSPTITADGATVVFRFAGFDSVVTQDGRGVVVSSEADLDPRIGNADHNMELFYYNVANQQVTQISDTTGGIAPSSGSCYPFNPQVNRDGTVACRNSRHRALTTHALSILWSAMRLTDCHSVSSAPSASGQETTRSSSTRGRTSRSLRENR